MIRALLPTVQTINTRYLRLKRDGLEHVPRGAPALLVGNHNGGISGAEIPSTLGTLWELLGAEAPLYALAHDFAMRQVPALGRMVQKFGGVRACSENAERILSSGGQALVYPGGDLEAYRHARQADQIIFGERTGFVRVAQRTGTPIVPVVVQGAHRSAYIFHDGAGIAEALKLKKWARVSRFPLALALPWGIAVGPWLPYLPLPFPVRLRVLPAIAVASEDDPVEVREHVRGQMQRALDAMAREAAG
jgi:1-acyl-sn-glycerol-3-phosphate acyltransferase